MCRGKITNYTSKVKMKTLRNNSPCIFLTKKRFEVLQKQKKAVKMVSTPKTLRLYEH